MAVTKEIVLEVGLKDSTAQGTTSAKQRLRELQKTLIDMSLAGQEGTKAFKQMEQEAGKLKDQIGDTSQRIKTLASDTVRIDTVVSAVQGITAGFQIAQGAAALFGSENEDLQKSLLKVQGAMALANGVQQVANLLNKDSILITQGQAAAQALYATAVGASTGAMKAFRIALLATGIGAAIAAVGLLIAKWDELTAAVRRFLNLPDPAIAAKAREQALLREEAALSNYRDAYEAHTQAQIAADQRREAQVKERQRKEAEATQKRLERLREENNAIIKFVEDLNLQLYEMELDRLSQQEQLQIKAMQSEAQRRMQVDTADAKSKMGQAQREEDLAGLREKYVGQSFSVINDIIIASAGKSEAAQKRAFNIAKAASIAQAVVNTYLAVSSALALKPSESVFPGQRFVEAGLALAAGLANVAKIKAQQFQGGAGAGSPGADVTGAGASAAPPPIFANPQTTNLGTGELSAGQGQGTQPMRAYVVERDITQSTRRVRRLEEFATLGA
jgi:predicted  nucleic acid-binding Zn-ribbon protein